MHELFSCFNGVPCSYAKQKCSRANEFTLLTVIAITKLPWQLNTATVVIIFNTTIECSGHKKKFCLTFTIMISASTELRQLTAEYNAINLGQGFPDLPPASFIQEALCNAVNGGFEMHQYTHSFVRYSFSPLVTAMGILPQLDTSWKHVVDISIQDDMKCELWSLKDFNSPGPPLY